MPPSLLSLDAARRLALAAQGFHRPRPQGRVDIRHVRSALRRMALLQLDYVRVVVPSHYLVLFSRLGSYDRTKLDEVVYDRREFIEQWAHEAAIVPMSTWPLLRHRRQSHRVRPWGFEQFLDDNPRYVKTLLAEIRRRGPLSAAELPDPDGPRRLAARGWTWNTGVKRQVLEALFGQGRLAVSTRLPNFAREYDLAERVVPRQEHRRRIAPAAAHRALLMQAATAQGVGTAADLADYFRMPVGAARPHILELVAAGDLRQVAVEGWRQPAYVPSRARIPRRVDARALLSPFDPVVWHRPRTARLFEFEYRFEIFIPETMRRWGTYVLPFLMGDRLVARVDVKSERRDDCLDVPAAYLEAGASGTAVAEALALELRELAGWLGLRSVQVGRRGNLAGPLTAALQAGETCWSVYMLRCGDGSLYTGITTDFHRRLAEHRGKDGRGARYLRGRGPLSAVLSAPVGSRSLAQKVEHRIKKMPRREKKRLLGAPDRVEALIRGFTPAETP